MQVCLGGTCTNIRELLILQSEASLSKLEAFPQPHSVMQPDMDLEWSSRLYLKHYTLAPVP
jgi:hypothetical protein